MKILTVKINAPADKIMDYLNRLIVRKADNNTDTYLLEAVHVTVMTDLLHRQLRRNKGMI